MVPTSLAWEIRYPTLGTYHSWWLPGTPVDGTFVAWSTAKRAYTTLPLRHKKVNGRYKSGGPWNLYKHRLTRYGESVKTFRPYGGLAYAGRYVLDEQIVAGWVPSGMPSLLQVQTACFNMGAEALVAMKPTKPDFSLLESVYGLKDVPGMFYDLFGGLAKKIEFERLARTRKNPKKAKYWASHAGQWFLAIEFGWVQLFRDFYQFADTFVQGGDRVKQIIRDAGKPVRRSRLLNAHKFDSESKQSTAYPGDLGHWAIYPKHVSQCYEPGAGHDEVFKQTNRAWCVGQCRYYLPQGPMDPKMVKRLLTRLRGGRLFTPGDLYRIIPWSWFIGYFSQLGSFLDAVSDGIEDRIVWDYAYVMHSVTYQWDIACWQWTYAEVGNYPSVPRLQKVTCYSHATHEFKTRAAASIFGFGLKDSDLSPFQLSIAGALGLSRSKAVESL